MVSALGLVGIGALQVHLLVVGLLRDFDSKSAQTRRGRHRFRVGRHHTTEVCHAIIRHLTHRVEAVVDHSRDRRPAGDCPTRARVMTPGGARVLTMLRRTVRSHRRRRVVRRRRRGIGGGTVHARVRPGIHVGPMENAEGLAEECTDVKHQQDRCGSLKDCVRHEDHRGRRDNALGNA